MRVLYVDADAEGREAVRAYVERERPDITLVDDAGSESTLDRLGEEAVDCLVVGPTVEGTDWHRLVAVANVPVVLYAHPNRIDGEQRRATTTLVEKGNGERSCRFLVAKIRAISGRPDDESERPERTGDRREILELLVDQSEDGLYTLDERGVIDFCNDSFADRLGYDRSAVIGSHASRFEDDEDLRRSQELIDEMLEAGERSATVDVTLYDSDGVPVEMAINFTLLTEGGEYAGLVCVARDVTERKARERELERYHRLVESAGDPMLVLDDHLQVAVCNNALADCFGRSKDRLRGTALAALFPTPDASRIRETIAGLDGSEWATCDVRLQQAGDERLFEVTCGRLTDGDSGAVVTLHDVTKRERRADELDVLKQVLTRVLRHDVRSGLTVIRGQAEVLRDRVDEHADLAETIIERSEELVETTEKARAIERVLSSDEGRTTLALEPLVNRSVGNVAAGHPDADYEVSIPENLPVCVHYAFPYAVEDLVENAVVHNDGPDPRVTVTADADDEWVELAVGDNGPGIPDEEIAVLERGEETPLQHGSGVGLWLVNWVVERSGGTLSFETDDGTTARIRLERGAADAIVDDDAAASGARPDG